MEHYNMNLTLKVWRQKNNQAAGSLETYQLKDISSEMSFLEMFDVLNEQLIVAGDDPIAFDHDCREGICGQCSMHIDGRAHGPWTKNTTCQLHMRAFKDGDTIVVEPWRSHAFPVIKDLIVDRSSFDRVIQAGGFISVNTGNAVDANSLPIDKKHADDAFMAAACIGCGACVAACINSSAMLFVSAKVSQLALLPQGAPERESRVLNMVAQMDKESFGNCSNTYACEAECPKGISVSNIARMNREFLHAGLSTES
ncbi:MAG: succinate dehydrogenase/fumarate reductase iron-sulfur subunit [Ferruginibacter sp.]|nr:succinate dehydrogenase/fumarate reductase iron-sulfur subunit [Chitinophagaceae bacterium]